MKLSQLKQIQNNACYTLCAYRENFLYISHDRGIAPIMTKVKEDPNYFHDCMVVDSVIGKAAAMMLVRSKVSFIHAKLMSEAAKAFLQANQIAFSYDALCPYIINRSKTGMCPMEQTVMAIDDMEEAYQALLKTYSLFAK